MTLSRTLYYSKDSSKMASGAVDPNTYLGLGLLDVPGLKPDFSENEIRPRLAGYAGKTIYVAQHPEKLDTLVVFEDISASHRNGEVCMGDWVLR